MAEPKKATVFDVAGPGAPTMNTATSSRPIIIKHPTVQDPMVNDEPKPELPVPEPVVASPSAKKVVIEPLHHDVAEPVTVAVTPPPPAPEPVAVPVAADIDANAPIIDDEQQSKSRTEAVAKLTLSEQYFLPIETLEQRRSKRTAIIGTLTIVILMLAWYNVALDASLLPNTFGLPHSSFFSAGS